MMEPKKFKRIGLLTSGGDAPGMNAAIRAIVRTCIYHGIEPVGIMRGYQGILDKRFFGMQSHSVSKIINLGGTMLKSSRCPQFKEAEVRKQAIENLKEAGIEISEMNSGCICCSLVGDFSEALKKVVEEYSPEKIQRKHIPKNVPKTCMHEHIGEHRPRTQCQLS